MIPQNSGLLQQSFTVAEQTSRTYAMDMEEHHIRGFADGLQAVEQAICKILFAERYSYIIYSPNYGVQLADLFGSPISFVIPEIKRRITDALLWDSRISAVDGWRFETAQGIVHAAFTAHTIYGDLEIERAVEF